MSRLPGPIPAGLDRQRRLGADWESWLDALPGVVTSVADDWRLRFEGPMWHGFCSLVLPVYDADDAPAVLKVALPDDESEHEHLVLGRWGGDAAVRLLRADPGRRVMLLERLDRTDLSELWDEEACAIVAGLYRSIHVKPMPQLRNQAEYVDRWVAALAADSAVVPVPRRLVEQALHLARDLTSEAAAAVIHGDLHYENVLSREGEWVVIDPKPTNGDPHYEIEPMLLNRFEEYADHPTSVRDGIRRRFHTLVDTAEFDEDRARAWVVVRSVLNAHWAFEDSVRGGRDLEPDEREHITRCIAIAKAVQD